MSRFRVPLVLTTLRLSSNPPSIRQDVMAAATVRLSKTTLPSSRPVLFPFVPVTVRNSRMILLALMPRIP
jgi:hypothetical protein